MGQPQFSHVIFHVYMDGWVVDLDFVFSEQAVAALTDGMEQLKMIQRQAIVSSLYPSSKSVME